MNPENDLEMEELRYLTKKDLLQEPPALKTDMREFSEFILEDNFQKLQVPEKFTKDFWITFDKELTLTNLSDKDIKKLMWSIKLIKLDFLIQKPDFELTFDDMKHLDELELKAFIKAKRSTGGMMRERALLSTQIKQFLSPREERPSGGIISKIGGFFGGRR